MKLTIDTATVLLLLGMGMTIHTTNARLVGVRSKALRDHRDSHPDGKKEGTEFANQWKWDEKSAGGRLLGSPAFEESLGTVSWQSSPSTGVPGDSSIGPEANRGLGKKRANNVFTETKKKKNKKKTKKTYKMKSKKMGTRKSMKKKSMKMKSMRKSMKMKSMKKKPRKKPKDKQKCIPEDVRCRYSRDCCENLVCKARSTKRKKYCVPETISVDPCHASPCLNKGLCISSGTSYTCDCTGTGFEGLACEEDVDECATATTNFCNSTTETCSNTVGGSSCLPTIVCDGMGNATCTEPFVGFFDSLSAYGSFSAPTVDKESFKTWMKTEVWESLSMETLLEDVPPEYLVVATENTFTSDSEGLLLLDEYMAFLLANNTFSHYDLIALQEEFEFNFTARRHLEEAFKGGGRELAVSDEQCTQLLTEKVVDTLVLCFDAIGIEKPIGEKLVGPLVEVNRGALEPAFATQFVQHDGLTNGFIASSFIVFLSTIDWAQVEQIVSDTYTGYERASVLLNISLEFMTLYSTGGFLAVARIRAVLPTIFSLFDDVKDVLKNSCFGDTIVQGCEDFFKSGGFGLTTSTVNMGKTSGDITLAYEMYTIKDEIEVFYEGKRIYWSGGLVSGGRTVDLSYGPGDSKLIVVRVSAPYSGTAWRFSITCPEPDYVELPTGGDNAGDILTYSNIKNVIEGKKYAFFDGTYDLNLVGIRASTRSVNEWDDTFVALYKDEEGMEQMFISKHFTTDPGEYYLQIPLKKAGCAILTPGQHRGVWVVGLHRSKYTALVQWGNVIDVYRDNDKDTELDIPTEVVDKGWHGINLHHGGGSSIVGKNSAGCQVFRDEADLLTVLDLAQQQKDHGHGGSFSYTLLHESDLRGSDSDSGGSSNEENGNGENDGSEDSGTIDGNLQLSSAIASFSKDFDGGSKAHKFAINYLSNSIGCYDQKRFTLGYKNTPHADWKALLDLSCDDFQFLKLSQAVGSYAGTSFQLDAMDLVQQEVEANKPAVWTQFLGYWSGQEICDETTFTGDATATPFSRSMAIEAIKECNKDTAHCAWGKNKEGWDAETVGGINRSITAARIRKSTLDNTPTLLRNIRQVSKDTNIPVALLLAFASRETGFGALLGKDGCPAGWGDPKRDRTCAAIGITQASFQCWGYGVFQLDKCSHESKIKEAENEPGGPYGLTVIEFAAGIFLDCWDDVEAKFGQADNLDLDDKTACLKWSPAYLLKAAIACYNFGFGNVATILRTDQGSHNDDYGSDVMTEAMWFYNQGYTD